MGVYYKIACDQAREVIDPGDVNDFGIKFSSITCLDHPIGSLTIFALGRRWSGKTVRLVDDCGDDDTPYFTYRDVTREVIEEYNEHNRGDEQIRYTGYVATSPPPPPADKR